MSRTRFLQRRHLALGWLALTVVSLAGCRSNDQYDLVARELRMQEDQLYSMEDYIAQYQQLVCKYRAENAELRRRLDEQYDGDCDELPTPDERAPAPDNRRTPSRGPTFRPPQTAPPTDADPNDTQIDIPAVSPLEGSTATQADSKLLTASHTEPVDSDGEAASAAVEQPETQQPPTQNGACDQVSLRGEVIPAEPGGGPRLMVDVQGLDSSGAACAFDGKLSLLVLERDRNDSPHNLARWDFSDDDAHAATEPAAGHHAMRFFLEVPADTRVNGSTELWVRLLPREGAKLLTSADVNLRQPGQFSSETVEPTTAATSSAILTATPRTIESSSTPSSHVSNAANCEWTIARAGHLSELAHESDAGQWRASSEPIPVVQSSDGPAPVSRPVQRAAFFDTSTGSAAESRRFARPTWSPDRSGATSGESEATGATSSVSRSPVWSDKR